MGWFHGKPPASLGLHEGRLATCPGRPNCVSSQAEDKAHRVAPLVIDPRETAPVFWERLQRVLGEMARVRIVTVTNDYLHAECASAVFGFVDDLECALDAAAGVVHLRSAARMGRWDLGQNRRRIETLRRRLVDACEFSASR
jgi:uncharacterized protein (DUF1499 family)